LAQLHDDLASLLVALDLSIASSNSFHQHQLISLDGICHLSAYFGLGQ